MTNSKLIPVSLLVLLVGGLSVVSAGPVTDFVNALQPGASQNQDMSLLSPLSQSMQNKIPSDVKSAMQNIKVSDLKQELKQGKAALKNCIMSKESPKQCLQDLKAAMPKLTALMQAIKPHIKNMMNKLYKKIQSIIPQLNSPTLKNMLQTVLNVMPTPPSRRRKRSLSALETGTSSIRRKRQAQSIMSQIKSLMQGPMSKQQVISLLKQIKQAVLQKIMPILQQIINMIGSMGPMANALMSIPSLMKALGTQPPSS